MEAEYYRPSTRTLREFVALGLLGIVHSLLISLLRLRNENRVTEGAFHFVKAYALDLRRFNLSLALGIDDIQRGENSPQVDLLPGGHPEIFSCRTLVLPQVTIGPFLNLSW